jgi:hypothetical protein
VGFVEVVFLYLSDVGEWKQLCDIGSVDENTMTAFGDKIYRGTAQGEVLYSHEKSDRDNHCGIDGHAERADVGVYSSQ